MVSGKRVLLSIISAILGVASIFYIVGNALPSWGSGLFITIERTAGLWQSCIVISGSTTCSRISCSSDDNNAKECSARMAAQAFITMACIATPLSALGFLVSAVKSDHFHLPLLIISTILGFVSFAMGVIGLGVGIYLISGLLEYFMSTAAILVIIATVFNLIGAIMSLFIYKFKCCD